jgi:nucleoside-diphosphate-sugar epimerase
MKVKSGSCIVIGGNGFIGSAVVNEAKARGYDTYAVTSKNKEEFSGSTPELVINANGNSRKYLSKKNPRLDFQLSVESVFSSLQNLKPELYVYLSTTDVYPDPSNPNNNSEDSVIDSSKLSPYGFNKFLAENLVKYHSKNPLIFRMGGFVGNGLWKNSIFDLLVNNPLRVDLDSRYQYMNTTDLAKTVFDLIKSGVRGETFNISGDGTISLREVEGMIPNCKPSLIEGLLPKDTYCMNLSKLKKIHPLQKTKDAVKDFIEGYIKGRYTLKTTK